MVQSHLTENDAMLAATEAKSKAQGTGRWMVASFSFDDGKLTLHRTTFNFPKGSFSEALRLLQDDIRNEVSNMLPDDPLPRFSPRISVLGNGPEQKIKPEEME